MNDHNLTLGDLDQGRLHERINSLQKVEGVSDSGRARIDDALRAAVSHVEHKYDLSYGLHGNHVEHVMNYLDDHYEGRHDLKPVERKIILNSLQKHFDTHAAPE